MSALAELEAQMSRRVTPSGVLMLPANAPRDRWLDARRHGITATDLPKILGLVGWGNAIDVYLDKRRPPDLDRRPSEAAEWGLLLEEPIARKWAATRGARVRRVGLIANRQHPWQLATLDRLLVGEAAALEVKTRSAFQAEEWEHGVPDRVAAQAQWQMLVTGLKTIYVAALIGGQTLTTYTIHADPDIQAYLLSEAELVWQAVQDGTPPEIAPAHLTAASLNRLWPDRAGVAELPPEAATLLAEYRAASADLAELRRQVKTAEEALDLAKLQLIALAGPSEAATLNGAPAFTYRATSTMRPPVEQLRALAADHPEIAAAYGITETQTRTFRLATPPKERRPKK